MKIKVNITLEREFDEDQVVELRKSIEIEGKEKLIQEFNEDMYNMVDDAFDATFYNISVQSEIV